MEAVRRFLGYNLSAKREVVGLIGVSAATPD
jgi:hypothetical protein